MDKFPIGAPPTFNTLSNQQAEMLGKRLESTGKAQAGKELDPKQQAEIKDAATKFEALLVQEMLKSMWSTVPRGELLSGSSEEQMYRDMLNQAVADNIAENGSMGIGKVVVKDMERIEKKNLVKE